jgi:imidazolonepropionase-like amidohydrolase
MSDGLVVTNVTVVDGTGGPPFRDAEVVIRDGRFREIRAAGTASVPADVEVFDARRGYLLPGLWESHTHLRAREPMSADDGAERLEGVLGAYRDAGITSVIELGGPLDVNTTLREKRRAAASSSADLFFAGPSFTGIDGWPLHLHHNRTLVREVRDADSARALLEAVLAAGTDIVKIIYDGEPGAPDKLPREALPAIVATAHAHGRRVTVHVRDANDVVDALGAGADGIEHTIVPAGRGGETARLAELFARTGAIFTPTFTVFEQIGRSGDRRYLSELESDGIITSDEAAAFERESAFGAPFPHHPADESRRRCEHGFAVLAEMRNAGVKIAAGSDVALFMQRPAALFRELQLLTRAGLRADEVIVAATLRCAQKVGRDAETGTISPGKIADALLLDADPTSDVSSLISPQHRVATVRAGQLVSTSARSPGTK